MMAIGSRFGSVSRNITLETGQDVSEFKQPVVAVGSSAGGVEALKLFVECIPADSKLTFIILQHLAPDHESQLTSILSRCAKIPCHEARENTAILDGNIYVLPPDRYLSIVDHGLFTEMPHDPRGSRMPIDHFMRTLADAAGPKAMGVVLSGTGSDGTLGLRAIKGAGGLTFAQTPETALYDGMPQSAVDSGDADEVGTIADICASIHNHASNDSQRDSGDFSASDLNSVIALLKARLRYDFGAYKTGTVGRRIRRRMNLLRFEALSDYLTHLRSNANELRQLADDMLINVTCFFRDDVWGDVSEKIIEPLVNDAGVQPLRVWVPACSSGEEAYTLAMLFDEHCKRTSSNRDWQIFATDLDVHAISIGREGLYPQSIAADMTNERLTEHFQRENEGYRVKKRLREKVVFARQNLLADPPFSRLDMISCRNLMIYLNPVYQKKLIDTFHFALEEDGFVLLGTSETFSSDSRKFRTISGKSHIYQRNPGRSLASFVANEKSSSSDTITRYFQRSRHERNENIGDIIRRSLLDRYAPAGVLVGPSGNIVHYTGPVRRFVDTPEGEPTNNIFDVLPSVLRSRVRDAIRRVDSDKSYDPKPVMVRFHDRDQPVRVDCVAVDDRSDEKRFLITFVEIESPHQPGEAAEVNDENYTRHLESELEIVREDLQTTVEELETSNEELKAGHEEAMASNEELQSTNEELETSREELQSLNEELVTVNHQLEDKIEEVEKATNDLRNLLASTRLPVLFLDQDLQISSFTTAMTELVDLRESDLGRPFSDLATKIDDPDLQADAQAVLDRLEPIEREITGNENRIYLRRIQPYRTSEERIGGVVTTFTDITDSALTAKRLASRERQARIIADLGQKALATRDLSDFFDEVCGSLREALACDYSKILQIDQDDQSFDLISGFGWQSGCVGTARVESGRQSQAGYTLLVENAVLVTDLEDEKRFEGPSLLTDHAVRSGISTLISVGDKPWGVIGLHDREPGAFSEEDLHILEAASNIIAMTIMQMMREEFLTRERLMLSLAMGVAETGLWTYDVKSNAVTWDHRLREMIGAEGFKTKPTVEMFLESVFEEDRTRIAEAFEATVRDGVPFQEEFRFNRHDGATIWLLGKGERMNYAGRPMIFGINTDISARKLADENSAFMMRELDHRVKNVLAIILSIAQLTSRTSDDIDAFHRSFAARIEAIARTHSLLSDSRWTGTNFHALVKEEVVRQASPDQVEIDGERISVSPAAAQALSMLLHELTTNAIKYGALSVPNGKIKLCWKRAKDDPRVLVFEWTESGGPKTSKPERSGFGSKVVERITRQQLEADAKLDWPVEGLSLSMKIPIRKLVAHDPVEREAVDNNDHVSHETLEGKRVLVLDDEWLIADQHAQVFHSVGAEVDGPYLHLKRAMEVDPDTLDLAVLDFALHDDHDVLPLAERLNEAGIPIVFVTGYGSNSTLPSRFTDDVVVPKPASATALLSSAAQLIDRRGRRRKDQHA